MTTYHLTFNGQGYLIDLASYRKEAGAQFAGKQASGNRLYADLEDVAVWTQTDWRGGRGYRRWDERTPTRWQAGGGYARTQRTSCSRCATCSLFPHATYPGTCWAKGAHTPGSRW